MSKKLRYTLVIAISLLYILANGFLIAVESYYLLFAPLLLVVFYLLIFRLDNYFLLIVLLTPLSVQLKYFFPELGVDLYLPTEPMIIAVMLVFYAKIIAGQNYPGIILRHPLSMIILLGLVWMLITTITSSILMVSVKYFLVRLWFVSIFFFMAVYFFRDVRMITRFLWLYIVSFSLVIVYATAANLGYGLFDQKVAHLVVRPFYNDHTAYGSAVAMFIPVLLAFLSLGKMSSFKRGLVSLFLVLFIVGAILSYSRATWISLILAGVVWGIIVTRIRPGTAVFIGILGMMMLWLAKDTVIDRWTKITQESSTNFAEHLKSIPNITTDASNLERINRWKSAMEMFREKPMLGWGPGTYMFQYAPFQKYRDRTIISTNFGDWGNVHSEYLGPLVDSGLPGAVLFLLLVLYAFITGIKVYHRARQKIIRRLSLGVLTGLTTYFIHGFLNNFLDTDKAAVPFWGFIAILTAMDIYYTGGDKEKEPRTEPKPLTGDEKEADEIQEPELKSIPIIEMSSKMAVLPSSIR